MSRRLAEGFDGDVERRAHPAVEAVVALGANLGHRAETMTAAIEALARLPLVLAVRVSEPIESVALKPEGPDAEAPPYLNAVAILTTRLAPSVLLAYLHAIERNHGRLRQEVRSAMDPGWEDRTLDLDLIAYGDIESDDPRLLLPHPRAVERDFVLGPWLTVDPDAVLPGVGRVDAALQRLRGEAR
ncbi:2-amino-4-hydroxy-6-hydroxymethyldihydropteridine diphosphokinase [Microbacterium allomyrinae]|uniref:2-amino-4-hydroxy-6-hydroxymethyldihydropteridine diphosphokinase n=1 Tax=Microbacterium allomyrinae TaxID=2830666 RepID=A0A9X1S4I5_9MICO|nr:2-amino-4-hydroxy-6-hydroxymethyldihydropteridine diphosphokinase [Microbacterium allomyrinae]MCC2033118.1 2-amino-4-hydroxy-6-hydroxymethyldihydropteridine diphosphokinase [Microbacterium allomyrinae]